MCSPRCYPFLGTIKKQLINQLIQLTKKDNKMVQKQVKVKNQNKLRGVGQNTQNISTITRIQIKAKLCR